MKLPKNLLIIFISLMGLVFVIFMGCSSDVKNTALDSKDSDKITIYTTLYVLADFSEKIGGEKADVINIVPPGVNAHDYEPTAKEMAALIKSDVFVYNGAGLETWVEKIIHNLDGSKVLVLNASKDIELIESVDNHDHEDGHAEENHEDGDKEGVHEEEDGEQVMDSHVWLDPINALRQAEEIKNALVKIDEENASYYENNFQQLKDKLLTLDNKYKEELKNVKRKEFFVSHASFGYLAKRYGLIQFSISGMVPADEPSPAELVAIIKEAKELEIKYILLNPKDVTKITNVLAEEIGAKTVAIHPIESLSKEEIDKKLDYIKIMETNLSAFLLVLNE